MLLNKCEHAWSPRVAFHAGRQVRIQEADPQISYMCHRGHVLIPVRESIDGKRAHFRHKNPGDVRNSEMSEWHIAWQDEFPMVEITHPLRPGGFRERRADALVPADDGGKSLVIEFQHSYINAEEVEQRGVDYKLHNRELAWVVDGGGRWVTMTETTFSYILYFHKRWVYESFKSERFIYLDIGGFIYRVPPASVKNGFVELRDRVSKADFLEDLLSRNHKNRWSNEPLPGSRIYYKQCGAGNGKTWGSVRLIVDPSFTHKNTFLYLTKMHSARVSIFQEFKAQAAELGGYGVHINPDAQVHEVNNGKAYRIPFTRDDGSIGVVYIGTIDSFTFGMCGSIPRNSREFFRDVVRQVADGDIKRGADGLVRFKDSHVSIRALIVVDETQDLEPEYMTALAAIMRETSADAFIIGDKLQSLGGEHNAYTFLDTNELSGVDMVRYAPQNHYRRGHNPALKPIINSVSRFPKFGLPEISHTCDIPGCAECAEYNDPEPVKLGMLTDSISNEMRKLAVERRYLPMHFAIISPVLTDQSHLVELEQTVQQMWLDLEGDAAYKDTVIIPAGIWGPDGEKWASADHCIMHQSEEGMPINLNVSTNATRIMSIHAAKGTGTKIIFVVDLTEKNLVKYTGWEGKGGLQYESFIHTAITRVKKQMYICYSENPVQDDIFCRFAKLGLAPCAAPVPRLVPDLISTSRILSVLPELNQSNLDVALCGVYDTLEEDMLQIQGNQQVIDYEHHEMRAAVFVYALIQKLTDSGDSGQLIMLMNNIRELKKKARCLRLSQYRTALRDICRKEKPFPILLYAGRERTAEDNAHVLCAERMRTLVDSVYEKLSRSSNRALPALCPLETLCFLHMIEVIDKGFSSLYRPNAIYRVIRDYMRGIPCPEAHDTAGCPCSSIFPEGARGSTGLAVFHDVSTRAHGLYEKLKGIVGGKVVRVLYDHCVKSKTLYGPELISHLSFVMEIPSGDRVVVVHVMPTLSQLNLVEVATKVVFDAVCCNDPLPHNDPQYKAQGKRDNLDRFLNKHHQHYVLSMNNEDPVPVRLDNVELPQVRTFINQGIRRDYSRLIQEVVHLREKAPAAYDKWMTDLQKKGIKSELIITLLRRADRGAPVEVLEQVVDEYATAYTISH